MTPMSEIQKPSTNRILLKALILYLPILIISLITLITFLSIYIKIDLKNINNSQELILDLQKKKTANSFREIFSDIKFLSTSAAVKGYCDTPDKNPEKLETFFRDFIGNKKFYESIQFIDLNGKRISGANSSGGESVTANHGADSYFDKVSLLPENNLYISGLYFTQEKPFINFSIPIFDKDGEKYGFITLVYKAKILLDAIKDHESLSSGNIILLDKDSKWIIKDDRNKKSTHFKTHNEEIWKEIYLKEQGDVRSPGGLYYFTTLRPVPTFASEESETIDLRLSTELKYHPAGYEWKLINHITQSFLEARYSNLTTFSYVIFIIVNIAFMIASLVIAFIWLRSKYRDEVHRQTQEEYVKELKLKRTELQEMVADSQELVHILCHDLLNPLSAIKFVLETGEQDEETDIVLEESLKEAVGIINTVKVMRALDSGKKQLELSPVNLKEAVEKSLRIINHRIKDKNINISIDINPQHKVIADAPSLVNSVISNLITNAVKFSEHKSNIEIVSEKSKKTILLKLTDHGEGIPESLLSILFDPTKPTSRPGTDGETGTGFGMPLVCKFMSSYGGDIKLESIVRTETSKDHGTTVILSFKSG